MYKIPEGVANDNNKDQDEMRKKREAVRRAMQSLKVVNPSTSAESDSKEEVTDGNNAPDVPVAEPVRTGTRQRSGSSSMPDASPALSSSSPALPVASNGPAPTIPLPSSAPLTSGAPAVAASLKPGASDVLSTSPSQHVTKTPPGQNVGVTGQSLDERVEKVLKLRQFERWTTKMSTAGLDIEKKKEELDPRSDFLSLFEGFRQPPPDEANFITVDNFRSGELYFLFPKVLFGGSNQNLLGVMM